MKETGELPRRVKVRSSQYLNNLIEQDHRRVKQRIRPMLVSNDSTTRRSPLVESSWRRRSRRASSKPASSGVGKRAYRNWGVRRSPLDPVADTQCGRTQPTSPLSRVCTRTRCGGGWKPVHGPDSEALPTETGSNG